MIGGHAISPGVVNGERDGTAAVADERTGRVTARVYEFGGQIVMMTTDYGTKIDCAVRVDVLWKQIKINK